MQEKCTYSIDTQTQHNTHTHAQPPLWGIFYSRSVLMSLVLRINTCQVVALVRYRRGQTVTESAEKIISLVIMPWCPFLHLSCLVFPSTCHPVSRFTRLFWLISCTNISFSSSLQNCYSVLLLVILGGTISAPLLYHFWQSHWNLLLSLHWTCIWQSLWQVYRECVTSLNCNGLLRGLMSDVHKAASYQQINHRDIFIELLVCKVTLWARKWVVGWANERVTD